MNSKLLTFVFLSYMLLFTQFAPISGLTTNKNLSKTLTTTKGLDLATTTQKCLSVFMSAIPPEFCWKKGADFGVIPTGCPSGYFRSLALCYEYCKPGYTHVLGVCWASCSSGYTNHGLSCYKNLFHWYFKHTYIPHSLTNFSSQVPCPSGMYRSGALCYRDCNNIGLQNCGIGACASNGTVCAGKIAGMVQGVFEGIATAVSTIASMGASTAVKTGIKTGFKAMGKVAINAVKNRVTALLKSNIKNTIVNKAKSILKEKSKEFAIEMASNIIPQAFCQGVWDESVNKMSNGTPDFDENKLLAAADIFNVKGIVDNCQDTSSDGGLTCATKVVGTLSNFDPTGVLTIAGAFMHPVCDVTTVDYRQNQTAEEKVAEQVMEVTNFNDEVKFDQDCVHLWSECNFKGKYFKACGNQDLHSFNDITASAYVGTKHNVSFFEHMGYNGRFLTFGPGTAIKCFADENNSDVNLTSLISNVRFDSAQCYVVNFRKSMSHYKEGSNFFLCNDSEPNANIAIREDSTVDNKLILVNTSVQGAKITLYEGANYTGKQLTIEGSQNYDGKSAFGLNQIGSYKVEGRGWIATVGWHTEYDSASQIHTISFRRFKDNQRGVDYYNSVSKNYAKRFYSKQQAEMIYSEAWAKYIVNPLRNYQESDKDNGIPYIWVSYLESSNSAENSYVNKLKVFENEDEAQSFYDSVTKSPKKFTSKGNVIASDGEVEDAVL